MKGHDKQIEEQISKTMQMLDGLPDLKTSPLFRVHVMERIDAIDRNRLEHSLIKGRLNIRMALAALLIAVNIGSATVFLTSSGKSGVADAGDAIEQLRDDYSGPELAYYAETAIVADNVRNEQLPATENGKP
ncbi:MAG: hypothetical protein K9I59_00635 [Chlorobium sp.]|uniref:hypothetical protein n=1 Tax=Chlorobium sp. TaxID=1095 RepID=UPI001D7AB2C7|nr:hypothetical protein [Chlorobium sp.]MBN1279871.1 hypothetical protein [Chlorobiaceae bacterium]MCF8215359.1 hypothetical protein [Chlorobium sp.]MCF8270197.1 hypothetical protein [Chlorobium sp.]MCF8286566.1 hypothetical protein [Chlorobium sp.]MCF8290165.1 hypothetical protein [Chlorobium sp.]